MFLAARLAPLLFAVSAASALLLVSSRAHADAITDAEDLFRRAKALLAQNKAVEACPLLKESYRLDPGQGTLLNLALCDEQIGKVASAWGEFRAVEQQARLAVPPRTDRADLARQHAEKLEPRLSRIKLVVGPEARAPGLVLKIDGEAKAEPLWSGVPVDPGPHVIEVAATGKQTRSLDVKVDAEGTTRPVVIPALDAVAEPVDIKAVPAVAVVHDKTEKSDATPSNDGRRTTGYVVGALGVTALAAAIGFGVAAIVNNQDAKDCSPCRVGPEADASNQATDRALTFANITNVTLPIGLLGTAVGAYLVLTSGPSEKISIRPSVSPRVAGLDLRAEW